MNKSIKTKSYVHCPIMANHNKDTFHENPVPQDDGKARNEAEMFSNDYLRKEKFKSHFAHILIVFLFLQAQ